MQTKRHVPPIMTTAAAAGAAVVLAALGILHAPALRDEIDLVTSTIARMILEANRFAFAQGRSIGAPGS